MLEVPFISAWADMLIIVLFLAVVNKLIQHLTMKPKIYFDIKNKSKKLNKEMKELAKENKTEEMKAKQKEAFKLVGSQFKMTQKSMLIIIVIAFPLLFFVKKYYYTFTYNFIIFKVSGLWAYVILGIIISLIVNGIYDKVVGKKYTSEETNI